MRHVIIIFLLQLLVFPTWMVASDSIHCHLNGIVVNRPQSNTLILIEKDKDERINESVLIPIKDGKFSYDLVTDVPRQYELFFKDESDNGSYYLTSFFAEKGNVSMVLYDVNGESEGRNVVFSTTPNNKVALNLKKLQMQMFGDREQRLQRISTRLEMTGNSYKEPFKDMYLKAERSKTEKDRDSLFQVAHNFFQKNKGDVYSDSMILLQRQEKQLMQEINEMQYQYLSDHVSLFGLAKIKDELNFSLLQRKRQHLAERENAKYIRLFYDKYASKYANHPYTSEIKLFIRSLQIVPGQKYPDYTVVGMDGKEYRMSKLIKNKVVVVDLWASWCGPCRKHSKELIPLYEQYKKQGFTVVAIARERNNMIAMKDAVRKDGYPWMNFVEINDKNCIWVRNGAGNAGGRIIVVGRDGKIVMTDPEMAEIKRYLKKTFN